MRVSVVEDDIETICTRNLEVEEGVVATTRGMSLQQSSQVDDPKRVVKRATVFQEISLAQRLEHPRIEDSLASCKACRSKYTARRPALRLQRFVP